MTRFWRFTLLTLLIALLPLRGWAWAVMPVSVPVAPGHSMVHAMVQATADAPCHAHQASLDTPSDTPVASSQGQDHGHTCSLCDLCHAGVIAPPNWAWFHDAPPVAPPSWALSVAQGRDEGDGLFRPPRA